jgi:hypothetical protein
VAFSLIALVVIAGVASAQSVTVGSGASLSLSNSTFDLGCSDLVISGTANLGSALVTQAVDVSIPGGGTLTGGSATLDVTGNWSRSGTFNAGTGSVRFVDGCGTVSSTISDSSTFSDLELTTTTGKQVIFEAGATTTVNGMFNVSGASGNLLQIRSTVDGSEAFLALAAADMGDFVDVKDNHAVPSPVSVIGLLASGNNLGWTFGGVVPSMGLIAMAVLAGTLFWSGRRGLRQRNPPRMFSSCWR